MPRALPKFTDETVRAASVANIVLDDTLTEVDGVVLANSDKVLVKDQDNAVENGIYIMRRGKLSRSLGETAMHSGQQYVVQEGDENADKLFTLTTDNPIVVDESEIAFEEVAGDVALDTDNVWTGTNEFQDTVTFDGTLEGYGVSVINTDFNWQHDDVDTQILNGRVTDDMVIRFQIMTDGELRWGPGDAALDTMLYRADDGILQVDNTLRVSDAPAGPMDVVNLEYMENNAANLGGNNVWSGSNYFEGANETANVDGEFLTKQTGDANPRISMGSDGYIRFGDGTAGTDVTLSRSGAGVLTTDGKIQQSEAPTDGVDLTNKDYVDGAVGAPFQGPDSVSITVGTQVGTVRQVELEFTRDGNPQFGVVHLYLTDNPDAVGYSPAVAASFAMAAPADGSTGYPLSGNNGDFGAHVPSSVDATMTIDVDSNGTPGNYFLVIIMPGGLATSMISFV